MKTVFLCLVLPIVCLAIPLPNIVEVDSYATKGANAKPAASALGFIVEADGFLLTTYKQLVAENGVLLPFFKVSFPDDRQYDATIIGVEPTLNFAVLKIENEKGFEPSVILRDQSLAPGQDLFVTNQLKDAAQHLSVGHLEALNSMECYQADMTATMFLAKMIVPESAIGSPVFDKDGHVVALYTGYEPPHIEGDEEDDPAETHLLPIFLAFNVYESIKQRQSLASPWTGFAVQPLNAEEQAQFPIMRGKYTSGIVFNHIWNNSPAEQMGMQIGDILIRFAHHPIHSPADFQKWLYMYGVGREVDIYLLRDGEVLTYKYLIEERPKWAVPE